MPSSLELTYFTLFTCIVFTSVKIPAASVGMESQGTATPVRPQLNPCISELVTFCVFKVCVYITEKPLIFQQSTLELFSLNAGEITAKTLSLEIYSTANIIHP